MKEDADEHQYMSESCGGGQISGSMSDSWHLEPLAMKNSSLTQSRQRPFSYYQNDYSYQNSPTQKQQKQDEGCGFDQLALKFDSKDEPQKVMHHFFDESPHDDSNDHNKDKDSSTTQLSISVPDCARDFFLAHNGNFYLLSCLYY